MEYRLKYKISLLIIFCYSITLFSQNNKGINLVSELISLDRLNQADVEINKQILFFKNQKNFDTLSHYIYPLGKIDLLKNKDTQRTFNLKKTIQDHTKNIQTLYILNADIAKLLFEKGNIQDAYDYGKKAKDFALKLQNKKFLVEAEYYLGDYAMKLGKISLLEKHMRSAESLIKNNSKIAYPISARVYNLMGAVMYFSSKQDSAVYYFEKALKNVPLLENNLENRLYLPAAIKGNLFNIKLNSGKHLEAKALVEASISLNKKFLQEAKNHPLTPRVKRNLSVGYTNLSSLYYDFGDFDNSDKITQLCYQFTKQNFAFNTEEYFIGTIPVAEVKVSKRDFKAAFQYLDEAKRCLEAMPSEDYRWLAYLNNVYGEAYYINAAYDKAIEYYKKSDFYYEKSNPGKYDGNRLYAAMNMAIVYSELQKKDEAIKTATKLYNYVKSSNGETDYLINDIILTLARINYNVGDFEKCVYWSSKVLDSYKNYSGSKNSFDKRHFEADKAEFIILNAKAKYALEEVKTQQFIEDLLLQVNEAIIILEQQREVISTLESVNTLIESNKDVFDFAKKLNLELYNKTGKPKYLENLTSLHESSIYNKLRVRLNLNHDISFLEVPKHLKDRENALRKKLDVDIDQEEDDIEFIQNFQKSNLAWNNFLDTLKQTHPKYYKMRYGTISESLENLQKNLPKNTSIVRYFFIDGELYAVIVDKKTKNIYKLDFKDVAGSVAQLTKDQSDISKTSDLLHKLYIKLWQPFENKITNEKVVIIPDRELFNLSFETLTPKKIKSFKELATNSLLAKHTISYNYSLFLLDDTKKQPIYKNNFVAFAPEFNKDMKQKYKLAITDSIGLDKTYLSLLQQPFSVNLAKTYSNVFDGSCFLNENSTEQVFKNNASEHKIIHIGTHAESNNISPELSRLIFAKDISISNDDNSLYTYEIYNCSLNSNLAILTACETGKPTYQSGEGMISLAHAFNYAGSESILTSLWKIDEQSSAIIIEQFYKNIEAGQSKDLALKNAKLYFITNHDGRALSPQFWAGLVLMGDTNPIEMYSNNNWWWLGISMFLLIAFLGFYFYKNKKVFQIY
ncbi:CHAT domain-containing protein [Mariniflexile fucanivorans]|uniref:CHAT domain-containing protein n=1 Tax=Mariniflexile fucanivorans TaxID=264023 RepID=A0A4V2QER6_9FLAO|nr:CHAT domain-containing protein [Mariniflexile fucanivorans]TCL69077.1 CHAT domain-containing protein [Mariniflexile fucanivorans]